MIVKVSIPNRFQFKTAPGFRTMLMQKQGRFIISEALIFFRRLLRQRKKGA